MKEENEALVNEQIQYWAEEYKRFFDMDADDVGLSESEQIPPDEMHQYVDNYRRWFEGESDKCQLKQKLAKLKKVRDGWGLNVDLINKMISYIESKLSQP